MEGGHFWFKFKLSKLLRMQGLISEKNWGISLSELREKSHGEQRNYGCNLNAMWYEYLGG